MRKYEPNNLLGRENAGHKIIRETQIENTSFVIGESERGYVTWEYNPIGGFYWGHYFNKEDKKTVELDYLERIEQEVNFLRNFIQNRKEYKK